jgi:hypothetical protein
LGSNKQALLAQHLQEPVPPQKHAFLDQYPFEHEVQLARAEPRLDLPFLDHQRHQER